MPEGSIGGRALATRRAIIDIVRGVWTSPADPALSQQPSFVPLALDGYTVVLAPALHQLNVNNADGKQLKSKLWICLKQLFNV